MKFQVWMKKEEINISKSIFEGHLGGSEEKINQQLNMDATKIPSLGYAKKKHIPTSIK